MSSGEGVGPVDSSARQILAELRKTVVGQETAIRDLATLLAMHSEWFLNPDDDHTAPNALIIGPTGLGKHMRFAGPRRTYTSLSPSSTQPSWAAWALV